MTDNYPPLCGHNIYRKQICNRGWWGSARGHSGDAEMILLEYLDPMPGKVPTGGKSCPLPQNDVLTPTEPLILALIQ